MELITIKKSEGGNPIISARDLYTFLEVESDFQDFMKRMLSGFIEGTDFSTEARKSTGGRPSTDYAITLDCAKHIALMSRVPKAKEVRQYFIECEKKLGEVVAAPKLPTNYIEALEALLIAEKEKEVIQLQLEEAKPKVEFYDAVTDSTDAVDLGTAAKVLNLGFGRTTLFEKLRDNKILMKNNQPFQKYIDAGWFRVIETSWTHPNGDTHVNFKTVVYQKGLDGIRKVLSTENF